LTQLGRISGGTITVAMLVQEREPKAEAAAQAEIYRALAARLEAADFRGADPYDALNSTLFGATPLARIALARLVWQQLLKRSPIDLRKPLGVAPTTNPVTLALAARTYRHIGETEKGRKVLARLLAMRCDRDEWGDGAWGYPFPWQAKAFYVPLGMPNIIATAYALRAVVECECWVAGGADPIIAAAADLVARAFPCGGAGRQFIRYVPDSDAMVHNASLWGAYVLALASARGLASGHRALAEAAIDYTVSSQSAAGAWAYGEAGHHRWIDGFHTGYALEALELGARLLGRNDLHGAIERGLHYYVAAFLREDGVVPYYSDGSGPLDANNFAQMVITLDLLRPDGWSGQADTVLTAAIRELWNPATASFAYQRHGARLDRRFYPRWTQIWMMHALSLRLAPGAE
jgi:hypothetical protein